MKEEQKVWPWAAGLIACVLAAALLCAWFPLQSHGALPAAGSVGTALEEVKPAPAAAERECVFPEAKRTLQSILMQPS